MSRIPRLAEPPDTFPDLSNEWMRDALCAGYAPMFDLSGHHNAHRSERESARMICEQCPVRKSCETYYDELVRLRWPVSCIAGGYEYRNTKGAARVQTKLPITRFCASIVCTRTIPAAAERRFCSYACVVAGRRQECAMEAVRQRPQVRKIPLPRSSSDRDGPDAEVYGH